MIEIADKEKCCGCGACAQACPARCIAMREDGEGFVYPEADAGRCIGCGLCERVCPALNQGEPSRSPAPFAVRATSDGLRMQGSSGGVFPVLASRVVMGGGCVFGAAYDCTANAARHVCAGELGSLPRLFGSKYLQSVAGECFAEVRAKLGEGREVLFCGTPCQAAGLRRYLGRAHANLLLVEVMCHGVPSQQAWRRYLAGLVPGLGSGAARVTGVSFRSKREHGWKDYCVSISALRGNAPFAYSAKFQDDAFMQGFLSNLYLRPSCHHCPARSGKSGSDLTLGDFWGIWQLHPELDDDKGVSLAIAHTPKGLGALRSPGLDCLEVGMEGALALNPVYSASVGEPARKRREFFRRLEGGAEAMGDIVRDLLTAWPDAWKLRYKARLAAMRIKALMR